MSTIIIGCGSRYWADQAQILSDLRRMTETHEVQGVVHGGARGADTLVGVAALELGLNLEVVPALWDTEGRSAGFRRNERMLGMSRASADMIGGDVVVLGWKVNPDRSLRRGGTEHMLRIAADVGVRSYLFDGKGWTRLDVPVEQEPDDGPTCNICDGLGHGYPGAGPCPLEVTDYSGEPDWAM